MISPHSHLIIILIINRYSHSASPQDRRNLSKFLNLLNEFAVYYHPIKSVLIKYIANHVLTVETDSTKKKLCAKDRLCNTFFPLFVGRRFITHSSISSPSNTIHAMRSRVALVDGRWSMLGSLRISLVWSRFRSGPSNCVAPVYVWKFSLTVRISVQCTVFRLCESRKTWILFTPFYEHPRMS